MWGLYRRLFGLEKNNSQKTRRDLLLLSVHPSMVLITRQSNAVSFLDLVAIQTQLKIFKIRRFIVTPFTIRARVVGTILDCIRLYIKGIFRLMRYIRWFSGEYCIWESGKTSIIAFFLLDPQFCQAVLISF